MREIHAVAWSGGRVFIHGISSRDLLVFRKQVCLSFGIERGGGSAFLYESTSMNAVELSKLGG